MRAVERIISGRSVGKIMTIIILSFRVGTSKNKNIDNGVKQTCAIILTQVTYEIDHISFLSSALSFCFYVSYRYLKEEDRFKRNMNSQKRNIYIGNQYYYYFGLPKIRVRRARTTKN